MKGIRILLSANYIKKEVWNYLDKACHSAFYEDVNKFKIGTSLTPG